MTGKSLFAVLLLAAALAGCEKPAENAQSDVPPAPEEAQGLVIGGERFTMRMIIDHQQGGLPLGAFMAPEAWPDRSQVMWNYAHHSNPVTAWVSVESPKSPEAFYAYPLVGLFWMRPDIGYYRPGQNVGGLVCARPMAPVPALVTFIRNARQNVQNLRFLGSKDLPELPAALNQPPAQNARGVGVKIAYDWNGAALEEEFYAIHYYDEVPYDGPMGRTWQINWGLKLVHSFRAPAGTLDERRPVFAAVAKSFRPNPAWQARAQAVNAYLQQEFNRQIQAGYDQIAAAGRLSAQISANNDAMLAAIDRQLQASQTSSASGSSGRSASDKFSDYIRGVDTVDDPYYGTSQHAYTERYHWTDGYGSYRHSNDASYNPGQHETGDWQLMPATP